MCAVCDAAGRKRMVEQARALLLANRVAGTLSGEDYRKLTAILDRLA